MDKVNSRIAQTYGYAVCLICIIVILVSAHSVIDAAFDYSNPLRANGAYGPSGPLTSYDLWRVEFDARRAARSPNTSARGDSSLSEKDMRRIYDTERVEQANVSRFRALRSLVSSIIFLILATTMFLLHWRWIRRTNAETALA